MKRTPEEPRDGMSCHYSGVTELKSSVANATSHVLANWSITAEHDDKYEAAEGHTAYEAMRDLVVSCVDDARFDACKSFVKGAGIPLVAKYASAVGAGVLSAL